MFVFHPDDAPTPACHAPTIAALPDRLVAAWFAGTREKNPDVGIWTATFRAGCWSRPREIADGGGEACWNPVLAPIDDGLLLFYKVGPSPSAWRGEVLASTDAGDSWRPGPKLPDGFLGPIKNKPLRLADGGLLCPSSRETDGWTCHFERLPAEWLRGGGGTATTHGVPDPRDLQAIQPAVFQVAGGYAALARTRRGVVAATRSADGRTWSPLTTTDLPNPNSGIDAVGLPDNRVALVHNPAETPSGRWGGARTPLTLAVGDADGRWRDALVLEEGPGEFSYPAVVSGDDGLHIVYTYRRRAIKHVRVPIDLARLRMGSNRR